MNEATVKIEGNVMVIRIPMNKPPTLSSSGKTLLVASTNGGRKTDLQVDGKQVSINVNAYIKAN